MEPDQALHYLKEGNHRFVRDASCNPRQCPHTRAQQVEVQNPFCAVLTCSDSRVPVEIVFDQGIGDIFVVRLVGNVACAPALESLQFAVHSLGVSLIVIMGHQNCGIIHAAYNHKFDEKARGIVASILPIVQGASSLKEAVVENVLAQVHATQSENSFQPLLEAGTLKICGAYYDFESGVVTFL